MLDKYVNHNRFKQSLDDFEHNDPHLMTLNRLTYQFSARWWHELDIQTPGVYILTGGRQVGKSTSCKQLIQHVLVNHQLMAEQIFYLPCDEIFDATSLSLLLRNFLDSVIPKRFLLMIDEITYVKDWDRVIKALADEGYFQHGIALLTGSDTLILKEAAMRFPGRRGQAAQTDFHVYPLSFPEYVELVEPNASSDIEKLQQRFHEYLQTGGYLRAINDVAKTGTVSQSTFATYEQWIRGDVLKQGKSEETLLAVIQALMNVGVSQVSYSKLTQKIGVVSKDTVIDYCNLLERLDVLIHLQAYDQNTKQGFPRKDRKFHFTDPFIWRTLNSWLNREGRATTVFNEGGLVEALTASHCRRFGKTFYFKGQGEVDIIWLKQNKLRAIEVKWAEQVRANDLKTLKQFTNATILTKNPLHGQIDSVNSIPVYEFLMAFNEE